MDITLPNLLIKLLIAVLAYWLGEKIIALIGEAKLREVLNIILIVAIVVYVVLGPALGIK